MKRVLMASLLGLCSAGAAAVEPVYDYASIGYSQADIDNSDGFQPSGVKIFASKALTDHIFLNGSFSRLSDDVDAFDLDFDEASLGVGYRYGLTSSTDVYGTLSYEYVKLTAKIGSRSESIDDNGYGLTAGVRTMLTRSFELRGAVKFIDVDEGSDTGVSVAADYFFTDQFALGAEASIGDGVNTYGVNLRYNFF
ncbi:porin family protein [Salinimonas iocasae]|uniref:Porin family protein n=1 Tax=Salinimonas iocasae TaxID=2572577 RepID=A0A5B7YGG1_9ALTE|nr:porin family protein [Salinimonas iocasae]QCZ94912.1 porin family protein [Salinimonas iocasae]